MDVRTKNIVKVLIICLFSAALAATLKIFYGKTTGSLAFLADGIHSLFDGLSTVVGIITVTMASHPPDEAHHYGHRKFETLSTVFLSALIMFAAFEVGKLAVERFSNIGRVPSVTMTGLYIILTTSSINVLVALWEAKKAKQFKSSFLAADSVHNWSDLGTDFVVIVSWASSKFGIPYVDAVAAGVIAIYLVYLSMKVLLKNAGTLVDKAVLSTTDVEKIVTDVEGVLLCHNVRSRGEEFHHFLDLNIHLASNISLHQAHHITHEVESRLLNNFPGLKDVVIHTEPEGHPPCRKC